MHCFLIFCTEGADVVILLQADPGNFWNIFYTVMFVLMMWYFYKTRRRSDWDSDAEFEVGVLGTLP